MIKLVHFAGFQAVWFASILSAADGRPHIGLAVLAVLVFAHLAVIARAWCGRELLRLAFAAVIGWAADSALVLGGWLRFDASAGPGGPSPLWMVGLWIGFAATMAVSMAWLRGRLLAAAVMGAVFGPLSYIAGAKLGAVVLPAGMTSTVAVAVEWAIAMPLLVLATERARAWVESPATIPLTEIAS